MLLAERKPAGTMEAFVSIADSQAAWRQIVDPLEPFLRAVAERMREQIKAFEPEIAAYAEYALTNQGKQLRPVLVGLSAGAAGKIEDAHVTAAVIIEMVHLATLVHDDIMDEASIRRGRPTLAANWGNDISVLLGDCLFAHALKLAAGFPTTEVCRAVATATNTVCSGEILQTQRRRDFKVTRQQYYKILEMKTGELFGLSCDLGAYISGVNGEQRQALRQYGLVLGTAYQIYDDCVDLFGAESAFGKSLGTDLAKGKVTLPILLLLESLPEAERLQVQKWIEKWDARQLPQMVNLLNQHQALPRSLEVIHQYLQEGRRGLQTFNTTSSVKGLVILTEFLETLAVRLAGKE